MDDGWRARPVDQRTLEELHALGVLDARTYGRAVRAVRESRSWLVWTERLFLGVGAALLLAGVVFFFAYNWDELPKAAKLGSIEAALALALLGSWWEGLDRSSGRAMLTGASVLVGVFLAVFGQVYQTGADVFELFQGWALLILPWTLLGGSAAMWTLLWVVGNLWLGLFWSQSMVSEWAQHPSALFLVLGLANTVAVVAREIGALRWDYLRPSWMRYLFVAIALSCLTIPALHFVAVDDPARAAGLGSLLLPVVWWAMYLYYRRHAPDVAALGAGLLSVCAVLLTALGRAIFEAGDVTAGQLLLLGLGALVIFGMAALALKRMAQGMRGERLDA